MRQFIDKNAADQLEHPDQAPTCTLTGLTVRTPQCGHAVWGKKAMSSMGGKSWGQRGFISIHEKQQFQPAWLLLKKN